MTNKIYTGLDLVPNLIYDQKKHTYQYNDINLQSVTSFIDTAQKKKEREKVPLEKMNEAKETGTIIHQIDEAMMLGRSYAYPQNMSARTYKTAQILIAKYQERKESGFYEKYRCFAKELIVTDFKELAGTIDTIWVTKEKNQDGVYELLIEDIKTGHPKGYNKKQLLCYERLLSSTLRYNNMRKDYHINGSQFWVIR